MYPGWWSSGRSAGGQEKRQRKGQGKFFRMVMGWWWWMAKCRNLTLINFGDGEKTWWKIYWFDLICSSFGWNMMELRLLTSDKLSQLGYIPKWCPWRPWPGDRWTAPTDGYMYIYISWSTQTVNGGIHIYGEIETTSFLVTMICFADNILEASIVCGSMMSLWAKSGREKHRKRR